MGDRFRHPRSKLTETGTRISAVILLGVLLAIAAWRFWPSSGGGQGSLGGIKSSEAPGRAGQVAAEANLQHPLRTSRNAAETTAGEPVRPGPVAAGFRGSQPSRSKSFSAGLTPASESARRASSAAEEDRETEENNQPDELALSGRVLDDEGKPVSGIEVVLSQRGSRDKEAATAAPGMRETRTTTDREGSFEFSRLAEGEYLIRSRATDRFDEARTVARAGVESVVLVVESLETGTIELSGNVTDPRGTPLKGVRVRPIGQSGAVLTDSAGAFSLSLSTSKGGEYCTVRFTHQEYRDESRQVQSEAGKEPQRVRLEVSMEPINRLTTVHGSVAGDRGEPVKGAAVRLFSSAIGRRYHAVSNRRGEFSIAEVESEAAYRVSVDGKEDFKRHLEENVWVPEEGLSLPIVLERAGSGSLSGRMVDGDGRPIPGFTLQLRAGSANASRSRNVTGDQQGRFHAEELPEGAVSFYSLSYPRLSVTGIQLEAGAREEVALTLDWGSYEVEGYVLNDRGAPVSGAEASLFWTHDRNGVRSRSTRRTSTDQNGYFRFTRMGPGEHTLSVRAHGFSGARREVAAGAADVVVYLQQTAGSGQ